MANTTNLNLVKPAGTDHALVAQINSNMDIIDGAVGALPSGKTIQGQINDANSDMAKINSRIDAKYISGQITSLDDIKSSLLSFVSDLETKETQFVTFYINGTMNYFKSGTNYSGVIVVDFKGPNNLYFTCNLTSNDSDFVTIGYKNGTWSFNNISSKIADIEVSGNIADEVFGSGKVRAGSVTIRRVGRLCIMSINVAFNTGVTMNGEIGAVNNNQFRPYSSFTFGLETSAGSQNGGYFELTWDGKVFCYYQPTIDGGVFLNANIPFFARYE